jgi:Xaa-Pro aminopeptidase
LPVVARFVTARAQLHRQSRRIWGRKFEPGVVFTVDPMMWIDDERLYVRMEDTIVVTTDGIENFTAALASTPEEIEAAMKADGLLSRVPRLP